jgi:hypothetical protein
VGHGDVKAPTLLAGTAKRRRIPRLRARSIGVCFTSRVPALPPIGIWYAVNVHPGCPDVNTLLA